VLWALPYDRVAALLVAAVGRATPLALEIAELGPQLSPLGPGLEATGLRVVAPNGGALRIERLRLRPAWSLDWLRLRPTLWLDAELAGGSVAGRLGFAPRASFAGGIAAIDLAQLPIAAFWPGAVMSGRLAGTLRLRAEDRGAAGVLVLEARDGNASLPTLHLPLPFETLSAQLELGEDPRVRIAALRLAGSLLRADATGTLGPAAPLAGAPLDLSLELEADPSLRPALEGLGVRLRPDGRARIRIGGTLDRPELY
jgi:type II secretion system protein N